MKTTVNSFGDSGLSLEAFAEKYGLEMMVNENSKRAELKGKPLARYSANFRNVEVKDGVMLHSTYGYGATVDEAIRDYVNRIEGTRIVHNADLPERAEINVPNRLPLKDEDTRLEGTRFE